MKDETQVWERFTVEPRTPQPTTCVRCKDTTDEGAVDALGRFWCEDCIIWILGDITP